MKDEFVTLISHELRTPLVQFWGTSSSSATTTSIR